MKHSGSGWLLVAAVLGLSSCAPYIGICGWVVPEGGDVLKIVEDRKPIEGECNCINCGAPGRFHIQRAEYTVEIWNGDRWYPELYLRARGRDGTILTLAADTPDLRRMAPHVPAEATHGFEYFVRVQVEDGKAVVKSLNLSVLLPDGRVLGTESVGLRMETRKDLGIEYL